MCNVAVVSPLQLRCNTLQSLSQVWSVLEHWPSSWWTAGGWCAFRHGSWPTSWRRWCIRKRGWRGLSNRCWKMCSRWCWRPLVWTRLVVVSTVCLCISTLLHICQHARNTLLYRPVGVTNLQKASINGDSAQICERAEDTSAGKGDWRRW